MVHWHRLVRLIEVQYVRGLLIESTNSALYCKRRARSLASFNFKVYILISVGVD